LGERVRVRGATPGKSPSPRPSPLKGEGEKREIAVFAKVEIITKYLEVLRG